MSKPNIRTKYFNPDGTPTLEGMKWMQAVSDAESKLTAIAAITKPTGGATIDAEARTAINAIIDAS